MTDVANGFTIEVLKSAPSPGVITSDNAILKSDLISAEDTDGFLFSPEQESPNSGGSAAQSPVSVADSPPSNAPMLPPCRICGEKASGFHYGANTCEACKGFFRRCLSRKDHTYKCIGNGNCEITPGKRSVCSYCRWKKCIDSGMSKSAIKTGRYTHEKKTRDIREVKRLQEVAKLKKEGRYSEDAYATHAQAPDELERIVKHITDVHMQHTPHTPEFFAKLPQKEKEFLEQRELQQRMFGTMRPIPREEYMQIYQTTGIDVDGRKEMIKHMIPCIEKSIKRFIAFAKALPGFKELPIDDQISLIKASRLESWLISAHQAFNREKGLFTDVCGYTLDVVEMIKVHNREHLESIFLVADKMRKLNLTMEEICVFKAICILQSASRTEAWHIWHHRGYSVEKNLILAPDGQILDLKEMENICNCGETFDKKLNNVKVLQSLDLTYEETVLLGCLTIMSADRAVNDSVRPQIEESQWTLARALYRLLERNHESPAIVFGKCIRVLTEERTISVMCKVQEEKFFVEWGDKVEIPPLFLELIS